MMITVGEKLLFVTTVRMIVRTRLAVIYPRAPGGVRIELIRGSFCSRPGEEIDMKQCPHCSSSTHQVLGRTRVRAQWRRCSSCGTTYLYNPDREPVTGIERHNHKRIAFGKA